MEAPFVGPAPLSTKNRLFGRDAEVEELHWRVVADRIMVLYSPSGAGKTSLLAAENGLLNELRERFHVSPVLRFSGSTEMPLTMRLLGQLEAAGFGSIQSGDSLAAYCTRVPMPASALPKRLLLVIDQFEELFTTGASSAVQEDFFRQLGHLLASEGTPVWFIASMREEYYSWLDQFRDLVPTRLLNTFRLNLLSLDQAIGAIRGPLETCGVELTLDSSGKGAPELIALELSKSKVRTPDGKVELVPGATVEPVQLQVICANLWRRLSEKGPVTVISPADLQEFRLDTALQEYCHEQLARCATSSKQGSIVRDWIDRKLLTPSGLRAAATVDPSDPEAPQMEELRRLQEAHLVRRQSRQDGEWFELAHDSLASPIRLSIEAWRAEHYAVWQQLARSWHLSGERPSFFSGLTPESRASIPDKDGDCSEREARFLEAYRGHRSQKIARRVVGLLGCLAVLLAFLFSYQWLEGRAARLSLQYEKEMIATQFGLRSILSTNPPFDLAMLAAVAGVELEAGQHRRVAFDARGILGDWLNRTRNIQTVESVGTGKSIYAWIADGRLLVAELGEGRHMLQVLDAGNGESLWDVPEEQVKQAHPNGVRAALLLDKWFVTGGEEGSIALWDLVTKRRVGLLVPPADDTGFSPLMRSPIRTLARSGDTLYSGNENGIVAAWKLPVEGAAPVRPLWTYRQPSRVSGLGVLTGPERLVSIDISGSEQVVLIKPPASPGRKPTATRLQAQPLQGDEKGAFYSVAVSPDQGLVAAGNAAGKIHVWDSSGKHLRRIEAHSDTVGVLRFLRDGRLLSAGWDGKLRLWTLPRDIRADPSFVPVLELSRQLVSVALAPDEKSTHVTTDFGDQLRVSLENAHPLARDLIRDAKASALQSTDGAARYFAATSDAVLSGKLDGEAAAAAHTRIPLNSTVAMAFASARRTLFAAQKKAVFVHREGASSFARLNGVAFDLEEVESVIVDDDASLLVALTRTTQLPIKRRVRAWRIQWNSNDAVACEVDLPSDFPGGTVRHLAFRPKSMEFITVEERIGISFWRTKSTSKGCLELEKIKGRVPPDLPRGDVRAVAFNPDGTALWGANFAGLIYSFPIGEMRFTTWKSDAVSVPSALAVSRAGAVAVGDESGKLYVIEPDRILPLQVAQEFHGSAIEQLDISPDGRWLLSSGKDGSVVWDLSLETWKRRGCALAKREDFIDAEHQKFFKEVTERPTSCGKKDNSGKR
ncbi:hypothetical protein [Variovorax sp. E3]|uniref:nSTAND1 domain-containing NTPase n=1 Tax=Variovorax sp. E3 TaxID=1914993 RepID=UPI0018DE26F7|nr:hypothetical protein [Variovorax sp. E3]